MLPLLLSFYLSFSLPSFLPACLPAFLSSFHSSFRFEFHPSVRVFCLQSFCPSFLHFLLPPFHQFFFHLLLFVVYSFFISPQTHIDSNKHNISHTLNLHISQDFFRYTNCTVLTLQHWLLSCLLDTT